MSFGMMVVFNRGKRRTNRATLLNAMQDPGYLMGIGGAAHGHARPTAAKRRQMRVWGFVAVGCVVWALSRLLLTLSITGQDSLLTQAGYPVLALFASVGLLSIAQFPTTREDTLKLGLDFLIALTSLTTVAWFLLLGPRYDAAVASGTATAWASVHFAASIALALSMLTVIMLNHDTTRRGHKISPAEVDPNEPIWRLVLTYAFTAAPLMLAGWQEITGHLARPGSALFISSMLTISLLIARQGLAVGQSRRLMRHLSQQIDRDPLTGLINHRKVHEQIQREVEHAAVRGYPVTVALIDVDNFKAVNDSFGHQAGDQVLRALAHLLAASCRGTDVAGRYAGDEFILVLPGVDVADAWTVCDRILNDVCQRQADWTPHSGANISLSIGVAVTRLCRRPVDQLVAIADAAMYDAKNAGKNRMVVVDADTLVARTVQPSPGALDHLRGFRANLFPLLHAPETAEAADSLHS